LAGCLWAYHSQPAAPVPLRRSDSVELVTQDGQPVGGAVTFEVSPATSRNHELNRSTFVLAKLVAGGELLEGSVRHAVLEAALAVGLDEAESRQTIDSAFTAGLRLPRVAPHRLGQ
jgi:hypothetical protein